MAELLLIESSWECGVLVSSAIIETPGQPSRADVNQDTSKPGVPLTVIPVPVIVPGERYGARKPWFYEEDETA